MGMPGSPQTVQRLVDEHYVALYRYAYRLSGTSADAEDLTQEAFCKAQLHFAQLRDGKRAKPWLFSILRNAYLHRLRAERQQPCVPLDGVGDVAEPLPESLPEVDSEQLQQALNELPEVFRTPIILFYFEDFGYREIAEQMDLPIGTVMSRLARARRSFATGFCPGMRESRPTAIHGGRPMDCNSARLFLHFRRPDSTDLDGLEAAELDRHLAHCSECNALARDERRLDQSLGRAMRAVVVPTGLRGQILDRLTEQRNTGRRRFYHYGTRGALAAVLLLAVGLGWFYWYSQMSRFIDPEQVVFTIGVTQPSADTVNASLKRLGDGSAPLVRELGLPGQHAGHRRTARV